MSDEVHPEATDPIEREIDLAWELYEARPDHPEIGQIVGRVLASQPDRQGVRMLLGLHLKAIGDGVGARQAFESVVGEQGDHSLNAARQLRNLARGDDDLVEARRWAEWVFEQDATHPPDWIALGGIMAMGGEGEAGWTLMDDGITLVGRTTPGDVPELLLLRAIGLFQSFAPPTRFIAAAEQAMRADAASELVLGLLGWAYVHDGRLDEARQLALRMLRLDPTDDMAAGLLGTLDAWQAAADSGDITVAEIHEAGVAASAWVDLRASMLGLDLASALVALDEVLPAELAAVLRPPLDPEAAAGSPGEPVLVGWHDGQEPGTGSLWGTAEPFRLLSSVEVTAMDAAIEADPEAHAPFVQAGLTDYYTQLLTDDRGGYLIQTASALVIRRPGADDQVVAPTAADWFWDRVAAFGGRDPRPPQPASPV